LVFALLAGAVVFVAPITSRADVISLPSLSNVEEARALAALARIQRSNLSDRERREAELILLHAIHFETKLDGKKIREAVERSVRRSGLRFSPERKALYTATYRKLYPEPKAKLFSGSWPAPDYLSNCLWSIEQMTKPVATRR